MKQIIRIGLVSALISACQGGGPAPKGPVSVSVSPGTATVDIGGRQRFIATVTGAPDAEIVWSLSGEGCANERCGWIDSAGVYSAPDDPPNPTAVAVIATVQVDEPKSASASLTISTRSNAGFSGKYALLFNGFEANNIAVAIAGSITADGAGRVTGGALDTNRTAGVQSFAITDGTYSFGADNRGRLNLNTPQGYLAFRFAMNAPSGSSQTGRLICFQPGDASLITGSGEIKKQAPAAFAPGAFGGDFAAGFLGELGSRIPVGAVGRFTLDGLSGAIGNGLLDVNSNGTPYASAPTLGTASAVSPAAGRGTARLRFPDPIGDLDFAYYVVSAGEAFFLGTNARAANIPLLSGPVLKQAAQPFGAASLAGSLAFNSTGLTPAGSVVTIGRFDANPAGLVLSGVLDSNSAGAVTASAAFAGQYDVAASGRGTLNVQIGATSTRYVLYMVGRNSAFLLQSEAAEAGWGWIEAQAGAPFTTASLSGNYVVGTVAPAECGCTSTSGFVALNGSDGTFLGARDKSRPDGLFPRDVWSGTFEVPAGTNGRGRLTAIQPSAESSVLYVVSPDRAWLINAEPGFSVSAVTILEK